MKKLFKAEQQYIDDLNSFTKIDAILAIVFYIFEMVALYVLGVIYVNSGRYLGYPFAVVSIVLALVLARVKFTKVGITKTNVLPSVITGVVLGVVFILSYTIIPGILSGARLLPIKVIAQNVFYYFIIIGFEEEIAFRGFIQPRLFPILKKEWLTILIGGILFVFMHYPFQMAAHGMSAVEYFPLFISGAPLQFMWHCIFSLIYRKFGNLYGSTILHGFVDLSMGIFG